MLKQKWNVKYGVWAQPPPASPPLGSVNHHICMFSFGIYLTVCFASWLRGMVARICGFMAIRSFKKSKNPSQNDSNLIELRKAWSEVLYLRSSNWHAIYLILLKITIRNGQWVVRSKFGPNHYHIQILHQIPHHIFHPVHVLQTDLVWGRLVLKKAGKRLYANISSSRLGLR